MDPLIGHLLSYLEPPIRASRLLRILFLLQNRGRMTSAALARELEVTARTILRDVDALTEAGLPVIVHQGNQGGIELGFNYRTRLTGLAADEAEALALMLSRPLGDLGALGVAEAACRARAKLVESFPDSVRAAVEVASRRFRFDEVRADNADQRIAVLAEAIRGRRIVHIRARCSSSQEIHPVTLVAGESGWRVIDQRSGGAAIALDACGDLNISALSFETST